MRTRIATEPTAANTSARQCLAVSATQGAIRVPVQNVLQVKSLVLRYCRAIAPVNGSVETAPFAIAPAVVATPQGSPAACPSGPQPAVAAASVTIAPSTRKLMSVVIGNLLVPPGTREWARQGSAIAVNCGARRAFAARAAPT